MAEMAGFYLPTSKNTDSCFPLSRQRNLPALVLLVNLRLVKIVPIANDWHWGGINI
jgi:hypothetical protein